MMNISRNTISNDDNVIKEYIKFMNNCINNFNNNANIDRFCLENMIMIEKSFNDLVNIYSFIDKLFAKGFFEKRFSKEMLDLINNNKNNFEKFNRFYEFFLNIIFRICEDKYNKKEQYKLLIDKNKGAIENIYNLHHIVF